MKLAQGRRASGQNVARDLEVSFSDLKSYLIPGF